MIALTVRQPWASQIADGTRLHEYREVRYLRSWHPRTLSPGDRLLICEPSAKWGRWAWVLADSRPVAPVPITRHLRLYEVPDRLITELR